MKNAVLLVCLLAAHAAARVIVVPDEQPTIQAGLNAAGFGDTVLVRPGTYRENVTWPGRDGLRLHSEAGPEATVIHGDRAGRVITMSGGAIQEATELRGFTITGGSFPAGQGYGAGLYLSGSFPVIAGNIIRGNGVRDTTGTARNYGGGIYVSNSNTGGRRPVISFNVIDSNTVHGGESGWAYGAGIYVTGAGGALVWQNHIRDNTGLGSRGHGAGVYVDNDALLFSNLLTGNTSAAGNWNYGAGVFVAVNARAELYNNTIVGNACHGGNWREGAGLYLYVNAAATVRNNVIVGNSAGRGGGIACYSADLELDNSHNDVWDNPGGNYYNCSPGPGDLSADPLFAPGARGGYYLGQVASGQPANSPCLDAGAALPELPLRLDTLVLRWTTRTDSVMDAPPVDIGYHYPVGVMTAVAERPGRAGQPVRVTPDPSTGPVRFSLPGPPGPVRLDICDAAGRVVRVLHGFDHLTWDGRDAAGRRVAAGVYPWRAESGGTLSSGRLVRLD